MTRAARAKAEPWERLAEWVLIAPHFGGLFGEPERCRADRHIGFNDLFVVLDEVSGGDWANRRVMSLHCLNEAAALRYGRKDG